MLESLDATFAEPGHGGGEAVVCYRTADGATATTFVDRAPAEETQVAHDELHRLSWVLEPDQYLLPHLLVVSDRTGAEPTWCTAEGEGGGDTVEGETLHIHRSHPGGWSQRRFQQRAENTWEANAGEVADEVQRVAKENDAAVIMLVGDVRSTTFTMEALPQEIRERVTHVEEGSPEGIEQTVDTAVATEVARRTAQVLAAYREALGSGGSAAGDVETLAALAEGRVETLLVHADPSDERRARFDPDSHWCAPVGESSLPSPIEDPPVGRLVDVATRSALLGSSEVRFVPAHGGPDGLIGATLRW